MLWGAAEGCCGGWCGAVPGAGVGWLCEHRTLWRAAWWLPWGSDTLPSCGAWQCPGCRGAPAQQGTVCFGTQGWGELTGLLTAQRLAGFSGAGVQWGWVLVWGWRNPSTCWAGFTATLCHALPGSMGFPLLGSPIVQGELVWVRMVWRWCGWEWCGDGVGQDAVGLAWVRMLWGWCGSGCCGVGVGQDGLVWSGLKARWGLMLLPACGTAPAPLLSSWAIYPCHKHPGCLPSPACGQRCHMSQLPPARQTGQDPARGGRARAAGLCSATGCSGQDGDTRAGSRAAHAQGMVPGGGWHPHAEPFFGECNIFGDCPCTLSSGMKPH